MSAQCGWRIKYKTRPPDGTKWEHSEWRMPHCLTATDNLRHRLISCREWSVVDRCCTIFSNPFSLTNIFHVTVKHSRALFSPAWFIVCNFVLVTNTMYTGHHTHLKLRVILSIWEYVVTTIRYSKYVVAWSPDIRKDFLSRSRVCTCIYSCYTYFTYI